MFVLINKIVPSGIEFQLRAIGSLQTETNCNMEPLMGSCQTKLELIEIRPNVCMRFFLINPEESTLLLN